MSKVENTPENIALCPCPDCPSYNDCAREKGETLFCAGAIGKGTCEYEMNGCICMPCPVHQANNLKDGYYCIKGSAEEIDK